jgi:hypothetical protein
MFCISLQAVAAEPTASPAVARAVAYPGSAPAAND